MYKNPAHVYWLNMHDLSMTNYKDIVEAMQRYIELYSAGRRHLKGIKTMEKIKEETGDLRKIRGNFNILPSINAINVLAQ